MSILGKMVPTLTKVIGGTKNKKDKFSEEANQQYWDSKKVEWTEDEQEIMLKYFTQRRGKIYLNLLCLNKGRHQALETDISEEIIKPRKQSRHWKFGGSYCVNTTQFGELRQFFVENQEQIIKNSKASMKIFRETFADYEVDNPNMEKQV